MRKVDLILFAVISLLAFASCTGNKTSAVNNAEQTILSVDDLLAVADQEVNQPIMVEGICTHVCSHGGKKLFLMGSDDSKTIRVESSNAILTFKPECAHSQVNVKGILKEERIDEAYLTKWEAEINEGAVLEHGVDGEGCETEQKAQGEEVVNDDTIRIKNFRDRIVKRKANEGKDYLSTYFIEADEYSIL
ncbi:MAG: hypothetical protein ACOH2V_10840 [Candidatus Saccharimonadaceae bacterium]